ncbi:MAG: cupin domain-containing protein [Ardenticatenaceae bacterium]
MTNFIDYRTRTGSRPNKFYKTTLFRSDQLLLGLNCLEAGQTQHVHTHDDQDKFYFVLEGEGEFVIGEETQSAGPGITIWAPGGVPHGVSNKTQTRLVILMGIAPAPGK